jgi:hypothetical protein
MRRVTISFTALLLLLFCGSLGYTQEPEEKPKQEQQRPEEARPSKPEETPKPSKPEEAKPSKSEESKPSKHEHAQPATEAPDHKSAEAHRGHAGKGGHIPDDKFRASFSRAHTFVISRPVIVENQPRFQYAGYWFEIVDPWPVGWAYTDECYIDYVDGEYFLFDLLHPGVRVALFVAM